MRTRIRGANKAPRSCIAAFGLCLSLFLYSNILERHKGRMRTPVALYSNILERHKGRMRTPVALEATLPKGYSTNEALQALNRMAAKLNHHIVPTCEIRTFGSGWGQHGLCNSPPGPPCAFYSFGISNDYSFDVDVANEWGCHGFAADPTIVHPAKLHPNVTFHSVGANMREPSGFPLVTSIPALRRWLRHDHIAVLKMDCEGCEYALGEDIAIEDPDFFAHVDQFAVEVHVSKHWLDSVDALHALGMLYLFLEAAGLELQHAQVAGCSPHHEKKGCLDELQEMKYPCGNGKSCHNYLFAKTNRDY